MADLNIRLEIRLSPRVLMLGLTALLLSTFATELSSENVTLTTYYPAPSGVYNQMITTQATYLARDGGNVGVGNTSPASKLDVTGNVNASGNITTLSGKVGIGITSPIYPLQITSVANTKTFYEKRLGGQTADLFDIVDESGNPLVTVNNLGYVGVGIAAPMADLDASKTGDFVSRKGGAAANSCTTGNLQTYTLGTTPCSAGQYATLTVGFMTKYISMGPAPTWVAGDPTKIIGEFFCCPCPAGSCPSL